jgi:hypothetical protein
MKSIIKNKIAHFARLCAQKLNGKANRLSPLQKKIAVILFTLVCSIISAEIIFKTVLLKTPDLVIIHHPLIPVHIGKTNRVQRPYFISPSDFERVEHFKKSLDSAGLKNRRGLMDSIALFEKIYQSQLKK